MRLRSDSDGNGKEVSSPPDMALSAPQGRSFKKTMRDTFGIAAFRPGQKEVIDSVLNRNDTLAVMPTGSGKSLCYQLPALKMAGVTVIVSPLIALMKDQADKLSEVGIDATEVNSHLSRSEEKQALQGIDSASTEFVFTTPERLTDPSFIDTLRKNPIDLFVIDEAHCISEWGHDFRPAYLNLCAVIEALGNPPVLALTATATAEVIDDIRQQLRRPELTVIDTGVYRDNLQYRVVHATSDEEKNELLLQIVKSHNGPGIVYAATIKAVEQLHELLLQHGESAVAYHGKMGRHQREESQNRFMQGDSRIMIATNAFGMGIDKQDIRFVVHYHLPPNLQTYYQESGRAGRDGQTADCILLYFHQDKRIQQFFMGGRYPTAEEVQPIYEAMLRLATPPAGISAARLKAHLPNIPLTKLRVSLKLLADAGMASQDSKQNFRPLAGRAKRDDFICLAESYSLKAAKDREALEHMVFYAQTGFCRWKVLLKYFDEEVEWDHCDHCDNCLHPPEVEAIPTSAPESARPYDLKPPSSSLQVGQRVRVPRYGEGEIVAVETDKITIAFPDKDTRTFLQSYVKPA
jgi:ATP-dependent DNA helicase RecQ